MLDSQQIDSIVKQAINETVEILDYRLISHSKEKVGFLGNHQNLEVTIKRDKSKELETLRFFVKSVPNLSEDDNKSNFIIDAGFFNQEAAFFNILLPHLKENYVGEDYCPKCLLANDKITVLQDMRTVGYSMYNSRIFDGKHLKSAVKAQARLHACSLMAEARLKKPLKDFCPQACIEKVFHKQTIENGRFNLFVDIGEQIAKRINCNHKKIRAAITRGYLRLCKPEDYKYKLNPVICHGDTWPNNYLFDSSEPSKCVLIDFQLVRYTQRMYDVAQLIYLSTTYDIRKKELNGILTAYYKELCETIEKNDPSFEIPSLNDILDEYEEMKLSALCSAVMYYPIIGISAAELAKYDNNPEELYNNTMLRTSNDCVMELYDRDAEFAKRLNELVLELVEYCDKLDLPEGN